MLKGSALGLLIGLEFKECLHGDGLEGERHSQKNMIKLTFTQHAAACIYIYIYRFTNVVLLDRQNQMHMYIYIKKSIYIYINCPVENVILPIRPVEKLWAFLLGVQKPRGSTWDPIPKEDNVSYTTYFSPIQ